MAASTACRTEARANNTHSYTARKSCRRIHQHGVVCHEENVSNVNKSEAGGRTRGFALQLTLADPLARRRRSSWIQVCYVIMCHFKTEKRSKTQRHRHRNRHSLTNPHRSLCPDSPLTEFWSEVQPWSVIKCLHVMLRSRGPFKSGTFVYGYNYVGEKTFFV